jgi:cation:H+ antiporter
MTPAAAIPVFLVSIAIMLAASAVFAKHLDHIGLRLGLPETLLGLLTALAADAPEISSAIAALVSHQHAAAVGVIVGASTFNIAAMLGLSAVVTGCVRGRHEALELEGFVGLWVIAVTVAVVAGVLGETAGGVLVAAVVVPYVVVLAAGPPIARRLHLGVAEARFLRRSFGEGHRAAEPLDSRREATLLALVLLSALGLIVAGSIGAVRSAIDLAQAWSVPEGIVGVVFLGILAALPNAWTGVRFGLQQRGSALISETLNSNSINIVVGLAIPAALGVFGAFPGLAVFDLAWLFGMTAVALALYGRRGGAGRNAGAFLILLYAVFLAVQIARV